MLEFVNSPTYYNWLIKNPPSSSLYICSPFIKESTLKKILDDFAFEKNYGKLEIRFIIRANEQDFLQGSSDIKAITLLKELCEKFPNSIKVKIVSNIHMKAYLVDKTKLLITSGNLTPRGLTNYGVNANAEGGIACDDNSVISDFLLHFQELEKAGEDISTFVNSNTYKISIRRKVNTTVTDTKSHTNRFKIPAPKNFYEYAQTDQEDTEFVSFKAIHRHTFTTDIYTIPQKGTILNYEKTLKFLSVSSNLYKTQDDLAKYLGSTAKTANDRRRMVYGILQNLQLYGLVVNKGDGNLPTLTLSGKKYLNSSILEKEGIIKENSNYLTWINDVKILRQDNPSLPIRMLVLEYLCNKPFCYSKKTAERYVAGMVYICGLHGIK